MKLYYLVNKFRKNPSDENFSNLSVELHSIKYFNDIFNELKTKFNITGVLSKQTDFVCYKNIIKEF